MFHSLEFENLRGVKHAKVGNVAPLSVFVGPNNTGKSTLLEGFYLVASGGLADRLIEVARRRGWCGAASMDQLFNGTENPFAGELHGKPACVAARYAIMDGWPTEHDGMVNNSDLEGPIWTALGFGVDPHEDLRDAGTAEDVPSSAACIDAQNRSSSVFCNGLDRDPTVHFIDVGTITEFGQLEDSYSKAVSRLRERQLETLVRDLVSPTARLRILKKGERHVLHVVDDDIGAVAVYHMGDGFKRLLYLACVFAEASGQLVLLEEPEAFQHPRYLRLLASMIWTAVEQGTQVVLSTHSEDLLQHLFGDASRDYAKAAVFKTRLKDGELRSVRIDGERAHERVAELAEDLRL